MKVRDLQLMLAELNPDEKVGYYDGNGGYIVAETAEYSSNLHDPRCECGCVALVLR